MTEPFEYRGINHLALVCRDMERTVDFYTNVLGMPLIKTIDLPFDMGQHFFFDCGGGDSLAFFWFPNAPEPVPGVSAPPWPARPGRSHERHRVDEPRGVQRRRRSTSRPTASGSSRPASRAPRSPTTTTASTASARRCTRACSCAPCTSRTPTGSCSSWPAGPASSALPRTSRSRPRRALTPVDGPSPRTRGTRRGRSGRPARPSTRRPRPDGPAGSASPAPRASCPTASGAPSPRRGPRRARGEATAGCAARRRCALVELVVERRRPSAVTTNRTSRPLPPSGSSRCTTRLSATSGERLDHRVEVGGAEPHAAAVQRGVGPARDHARAVGARS